MCIPEEMSTFVQVSVVDRAQQQTEGKKHHRLQQDKGPLPSHWDLSFSDNSLLSVYCFIKNFIGSQTASEKTAAADVGRDLDPDCGSAASTGTSTVAIDNKIEQAMDLVKSHLMFAVREEVEVLKEKITELLERISQLEQENDILRANASPETLNQLNQSQNNAQGKSAHSPSQGAPPHSLPQPSSS